MQELTDPPPVSLDFFSATSSVEAQLQASVNRTQLREFQDGLEERLRHAQSAPVKQNNLALRIMDCNYLIDLPQAGEIIPVPEMTVVPLTKSWYRGLANVRGNLVSIIDLNLFRGGPATSLDKDSRVLVFANDMHFHAGILVSRMQGLRSIYQMQTASASDARVQPNWIARYWQDDEAVLWEELDLPALMADSHFLNIGIW